MSDAASPPPDPVASEERLRRGHLADPADVTATVHRYPAPGDLDDLLQWYWVPVWSVPDGRRSVQRVLQHPAPLIVVTAAYARFAGVTTGLSSTELEGDGWAVGALLRPAAGTVLLGAASPPVAMAELTDHHVELAELFGEEGARLVDGIRSAMADAPADAPSHLAATDELSAFLRRRLPVDDEGRLINRLVQAVDDDPSIVRVGQLAELAACSERTLQRLVQHRLGLTPKWLIQRRRLQEASLRLRDGDGGRTLAELAAELGYADQAHLVRDVRTVTGWTPTQLRDRLGGTAPGSPTRRPPEI